MSRAVQEHHDHVVGVLKTPWERSRFAGEVRAAISGIVPLSLCPPGPNWVTTGLANPAAERKYFA
jgi:hypothetical protein